MAKRPAKSGKQWTSGDKKQLRHLAGKNKPTRLIAWELDRSADAIYKQASNMGVPLKPTNQSPYNRRKK